MALKKSTMRLFTGFALCLLVIVIIGAIFFTHSNPVTLNQQFTLDIKKLYAGNQNFAAFGGFGPNDDSAWQTNPPGDTSKKKAAAKAPGKIKVNTKFFKSLANILGIGVKADIKSKVGNIALQIDSLIRDDSMHATTKNVDSLVAILKADQKANFATLIKFLHDTVTVSLDSVLSNVKAVGAEIEQEKGNTVKKPAKVINDPVAPVDIAELAEKVLPLVTPKAAEEEQDKSKWARIAFISALINGHKDQVFIFDSAKNVIRKYKLRYSMLKEVYGTYNYKKDNDSISDSYFNFLTGLIYNGFLINEKTGHFLNLKGWDSSTVIEKAHLKKCGIIPSFSIEKSDKLGDFLKDDFAKRNFINNLISLSKQLNATGVNFSFLNLSPGDKQHFTEFINQVSDSLKIAASPLELFITLPFIDTKGAFDIKALKHNTDRFILNYNSQPPLIPGSFFSLSEKNSYSIEAAISSYESVEMDLSKLVLAVPYKGIEWNYSTSKNGDQLVHVSWLPYNKIKLMQRGEEWTNYYMDVSDGAIMDSLDSAGNIIKKISFQDETSLGKKYDYVTSNALKGIAINALQNDSGYAELSDLIEYKFVKIDSTFIGDSDLTIPQLTFLGKLKRYFELTNYIFENPCKDSIYNEGSYANNSTKATETTVKLITYIKELKIDSIKYNLGQKPLNGYKYTLTEEYYFVQYQVVYVLGLASLILLTFFIVAGVFYLSMLKKTSGPWKGKKLLEIFLFISFLLLTFFGFTYIFCNKKVPLIGSRFNGECSNTSLYVLMLIITIGGVVGFIITRFLIFSKRKDTP